MRIIERYITGSIIAIFLTTISIFCFLYVLIDVASNLTEILDRQVPLPILVQYYAASLPIVLVHTPSIACLIAVLLTYSRLNNQNEVIALRSSGMNFWQITKPALIFAMVIATLVFLINERFVPQATQSAEKIRNENIILEVDTLRKRKETIKNLTFYGLKNRLFFVDEFDPNTYELKGITIIGHDENQDMSEKISALKGTWTGIAWKFFQCQIALFDSGNIANPDEIRYYPEKLMDIPESPQDFLEQRLNVTSMNIRQLREYIQRFKTSGAIKAIHSLRVDLHQKIAFPFRSIVIVLVGLPFALMTGRRKGLTFTTLGIAIAIGFLFYVTDAVGLALGKGGLFPPLVSAWLSIVIFTCVALYLIKSKF